MTSGVIREKTRDVTSGRAMDQGLMEVGEERVEPRVEITDERTKPMLVFQRHSISDSTSV